MVIISLFLSMALILFLVNKKINIGISLLIGSMFMMFLNKRGFLDIYEVLKNTFSDYTTINLILSITFITILGYLMEKFQLMDRMVDSLEKVLRSVKITILLAPALIGTLLVTGGALMSCPVVKSLGNRLGITHDEKASINLIFRHALYFVYPLAPTLILAAQVGEFEIMDLIKLQIPMTLTIYILGYMLFVRQYEEPKIEKISGKQYMNNVMQFIVFSSPILVSLLGVVLFRLPFYISLIIGIAISVIINKIDSNRDEKYKVDENTLKVIYNGINSSMVMAIIGIMVFKNVVNSMDELYTTLEAVINTGFPIEILMLVSSAIICYPLASTQPGVAILYPLILPLAPSYEVKLLYAMFIYTSSFMFYYISPLHLCQVLTLEYFDVSIKELFNNYKIILPLTYVVMLIIYITKMFFM